MIASFERNRLNRSVHVGAGLRLSDLNERLYDHGLSFPIDLGADPRISCMDSTKMDGTRFFRDGDVRRNTLGLRSFLIGRAA